MRLGLAVGDELSESLVYSSANSAKPTVDADGRYLFLSCSSSELKDDLPKVERSDVVSKRRALTADGMGQSIEPWSLRVRNRSAKRLKPRSERLVSAKSVQFTALVVRM